MRLDIDLPTIAAHMLLEAWRDDAEQSLILLLKSLTVLIVNRSKLSVYPSATPMLPRYHKYLCSNYYYYHYRYCCYLLHLVLHQLLQFGMLPQH